MSRLEIPPDVYEARIEQLEAQHRQALRTIAELEERDALKTRLLSNISHDLRTPLTAIITHAEILRDGILGELTERQLESIGGIIGGGRQLLGMVGEILTYARSAAGQVTLNLSRFELRPVVDQIVALNEALVAKKGLTLMTDVAADVPPLRADREKVAHIVSNLLGNAVAFTPPGGRVWVVATLGSEDESTSRMVQVEVGDSGIGIAPEHHDFVFREFAQVDSSPSRQHHGTGLGLTIARRFVQLHGGRMWLESNVGAGSRFYFTLPVRAAADD
ncbi:MAG TPA: HAMP domain-containing sensor histidine kinase [Gemmatimonadaceae bacterium]|nr:HAMP domain-containing sensor histidine kinase [Gemmatimonadaceae bacterium]